MLRGLAKSVEEWILLAVRGRIHNRDRESLLRKLIAGAHQEITRAPPEVASRINLQTTMPAGKQNDDCLRLLRGYVQEPLRDAGTRGNINYTLRCQYDAA